MGAVEGISYNEFPKQGILLGKDVSVCFWYNTEYTFNAKCVRDDREEPYETIFILEDNRVVRATECMYQIL